METPKRLTPERLEEIRSVSEYGFFGRSPSQMVYKELLSHIAYQAARIAELEAGIMELKEMAKNQPCNCTNQGFKVTRCAYCIGTDKIQALLSPKDTQGEGC